MQQVSKDLFLLRFFVFVQLGTLHSTVFDLLKFSILAFFVVIFFELLRKKLCIDDQARGKPDIAPNRLRDLENAN